MKTDFRRTLERIVAPLGATKDGVSHLGDLARSENVVVLGFLPPRPIQFDLVTSELRKKVDALPAAALVRAVGSFMVVESAGSVLDSNDLDELDALAREIQVEPSRRIWRQAAVEYLQSTKSRRGIEIFPAFFNSIEEALEFKSVASSLLISVTADTPPSRVAMSFVIFHPA